MSFIWNVMLSFDNEELWEDGEDESRETCEPLDGINAWLSPARLVSLTGPTYEDDAGYGMDANLYGGGFKHFDMARDGRSPRRPRTRAGRHTRGPDRGTLRRRQPSAGREPERGHLGATAPRILADLRAGAADVDGVAA